MADDSGLADRLCRMVEDIDWMRSCHEPWPFTDSSEQVVEDLRAAERLARGMQES